MTKQSYTSMITHTDDATFRVWGLQLSTALQACGLVKTTDTGQINWTTVTRPGINTDAGYEIYRFDDAMQATRPIFLKISYGTGAAVTTQRVTMQIASGTNGAGTLTGVSYLAQNQFTRNNSPTFSGVTYVVHTNSYLAIVFSSGAMSSTALGLLILERSKDDTGAVVDEGLYLMMMTVAGTNVAGAYSFTSSTWVPAALAVGGIGCFVPGLLTSTTIGSDVQVFRHFMVTPRVRCAAGCLTYLESEFATGSPFTVAAVGSTPRTYMPISKTVQALTAINVPSGCSLAILWED